MIRKHEYAGIPGYITLNFLFLFKRFWIRCTQRNFLLGAQSFSSGCTAPTDVFLLGAAAPTTPSKSAPLVGWKSPKGVYRGKALVGGLGGKAPQKPEDFCLLKVQNPIKS